MNLHSGQRVVCISNAFDDHCYLQYPKVGSVYTVRDIDASEGVLLVEIKNFAQQCYDSRTGMDAGLVEPSFFPHHFRPVKNTNIDVFIAMLAPTPKKTERV